MEKSKGGIKVRAGLTAGGMWSNHNRQLAGVRVRAGLTAGGVWTNHNRRALRI
jgi:hypothetical protein